MKRSYNYTFVLGLGFNSFVEDAALNQVFSVSKTWHIPPYPTSVNIQLYLRKGLSFNGTASFYSFQRPKTVLGQTGYSNYIPALQAQLKLHSRSFIETGNIDPYLLTGVGFTNRIGFSALGTPFYVNLGGGIDYWIKNKFGIGVATAFHLAIDNKIVQSPSNYQTFSIQASYKFGTIYVHRSRSKARYKWTKNRQNYRFKRSNR